VPDAYLERERINLVHAAQRLHEADHVLHGRFGRPWPLNRRHLSR
jgi:hypothetical protein